MKQIRIKFGSSVTHPLNTLFDQNSIFPQVGGEEIQLLHSSNEGGKYDEDNSSENLLGVF